MIMEHWLSAGAGIFLIGMMLYGHYRGMLRQCVSLGALILTILVVKVGTPYITGFIRANPMIRENAAQLILDSAGWETPSQEESQLPSAERIAIEQMKLPKTVKDVLLENNNNEFYQMLGVNQFAEYVSTYLADMLINAVVSLLIFIASYILIHLIVRWLDLISRLPILSGLNHIAGAVLGLTQGILFLWVAGFILSFFSATPFGQMLEEQINASKWLGFLYHYNLINLLLGGIIKSIF